MPSTSVNLSRHAALPTGPARRDVVLGAAAGAVLTGATVATAAPARAASAAATDETTGFLHGVASGDPLPTAVVLWTRRHPVR